jgi:group II intron reverse transcriptase/maturase
MERQDSEIVSTKQERIAELARLRPKLIIRSLSHHLDLAWMREAFRRTRKTGAAGVDGQTGADYAVELEANLLSLLDRAKSGDRYRAPAVRRVHIPKGDGSTRPLGIPTFEDKLLQRAVAMLLEPVYEQDFLDCSYGFRRGRNAHQALAEVQGRLTRMGGGWVLDVDLRKFFDTLDHGKLQEMLRQRIGDGVVLRLIGKWLNAGVLEEGCLTRPEAGTPQGGVISPLLANIYLHEVLDEWFETAVKPRLMGRAFLVRYADDLAMGFDFEEDARRVLAVLPKRLERYGLRLHPEKTRLVDFRKPRNNPEDGGSGPGSFDLLGFTHFWGKSRKGTWVVKRKTAKSRMTRALKGIKEWCRGHRFAPVRVQRWALAQKLKGHYAYFGITGNSPALGRFHKEVIGIWKKWLCRRSQRARLSWRKFWDLLRRHPLPEPICVHSIYRRC